MSIHLNSNGNLCEDSFDKILEEQTLDLAIRAETILKQPGIYNYKKSHTAIINNIRLIISRWESTEALLSRSEFTALKENIELLDRLSKTPLEKPASGNSDYPVTSQKSTESLNSVVANDTPIEPHKLYTVKASNGNHTFPVVFSEKTAQMINQNRTDIKVIKSMKALLAGHSRDKGRTSGIKKMTRHKSLYEIKIIGKKSVGNFRLGIFLHDGVYYIAGYTHQHIERSNTFIQGLIRALKETTQRKGLTKSL